MKANNSANNKTNTDRQNKAPIYHKFIIVDVLGKVKGGKGGYPHLSKATDSFTNKKQTQKHNKT